MSTIVDISPASSGYQQLVRFHGNVRRVATVRPPRLQRPGRAPGSPPNREAILAAARALFGERGYERATIRAIAARAGVDAALVYHYFGSKDRLLGSALRVGEGDVLPELVAQGVDGVGERIIRGTFAHYDRLPAGELGALIGLLRSATTNPDAARVLRESFETGGLARIALAVGLPQPRLRATLAGSTLFGLAMARYVVRLEPIASADVESLVAWYAPTLQRYLAEPLPGDG
jgi:AcrR family transcriptional regulator